MGQRAVGAGDGQARWRGSGGAGGRRRAGRASPLHAGASALPWPDDPRLSGRAQGLPRRAATELRPGRWWTCEVLAMLLDELLSRAEHDRRRPSVVPASRAQRQAEGRPEHVDCPDLQAWTGKAAALAPEAQWAAIGVFRVPHPCSLAAGRRDQRPLSRSFAGLADARVRENGLDRYRKISFDPNHAK